MFGTAICVVKCEASRKQFSDGVAGYGGGWVLSGLNIQLTEMELIDTFLSLAWFLALEGTYCIKIGELFKKTSGRNAG